MAAAPTGGAFGVDSEILALLCACAICALLLSRRGGKRRGGDGRLGLDAWLAAALEANALRSDGAAAPDQAAVALLWARAAGAAPRRLCQRRCGRGRAALGRELVALVERGGAEAAAAFLRGGPGGDDLARMVLAGALASLADVGAAMAVYRRMRSAAEPLDCATRASLILAFACLGRTACAQVVLADLAEDGCRQRTARDACLHSCLAGALLESRQVAHLFPGCGAGCRGAAPEELSPGAEMAVKLEPGGCARSAAPRTCPSTMRPVDVGLGLCHLGLYLSHSRPERALDTFWDMWGWAQGDMPDARVCDAAVRSLIQQRCLHDAANIALATCEPGVLRLIERGTLGKLFHMLREGGLLHDVGTPLYAALKESGQKVHARWVCAPRNEVRSRTQGRAVDAGQRRVGLWPGL